MADPRYRNPVLKELADQQVRFAPVPVQVEQIERAEDLLLTLKSGESYPYPVMCEIITRYRPDRYPNLVLPGQDLMHDLRCFIEDLSDSANLSVEAADEPILTVDEVSERFNVSTKTVQRWRDRGLASRKYRFGNRKRVGFRESFVDRFAEKHQDEVARGGRFTQLTEAEQEFIIGRARRLALAGATMTDISRRLSRRTGRARETIRYTLRTYDRSYPESAVFPGSTGPLSESDKRAIATAVRQGVPARRLASKYGRTRTSIHRIAAEYRVKSLIDQPIEFIYSDSFENVAEGEPILEAPFELELPEHSPVDVGAELPSYLADLYACPVLTREQEQFLFRKMNYLKYLASKNRDALRPSSARSADMERIEQLLAEGLTVKNVLIRCNLRLVVSIARRHRRPSTNFFEMISDGNMTLIRAIERFDFTRGNKFSTYATWAIMRTYARSIPAEGVHLDRFRTGTDEFLSDSADERTTIHEDEQRAFAQWKTIESILDALNEREQEAISLRFALKDQSAPLTLEQIGNRLGISKERTRQIINTGLEKLRRIAEETGVDLLNE